jgi:hypothetical protein
MVAFTWNMSKTNTECLDVLGIDYSVVAVADDEYVVTYGTGEGTFAYAALDITLERALHDFWDFRDRPA